MDKHEITNDHMEQDKTLSFRKGEPSYVIYRPTSSNQKQDLEGLEDTHPFEDRHESFVQLSLRPGLLLAQVLCRANDAKGDGGDDLTESLVFGLEDRLPEGEEDPSEAVSGDWRLEAVVDDLKKLSVADDAGESFRATLDG